MCACQNADAASHRIQKRFHILCVSDLIAYYDLRRHRAQKHADSTRFIRAAHHIHSRFWRLTAEEFSPFVADCRMQPAFRKIKRRIAQNRRFSASRRTQQQYTRHTFPSTGQKAPNRKAGIRNMPRDSDTDRDNFRHMRTIVFIKRHPAADTRPVSILQRDKALRHLSFISVSRKAAKRHGHFFHIFLKESLSCPFDFSVKDQFGRLSCAKAHFLQPCRLLFRQAQEDIGCFGRQPRRKCPPPFFQPAHLRNNAKNAEVSSSAFIICQGIRF